MFSAKDVALVDLLVERHRFDVVRLLAEHALQLVELRVLVGICLLGFL